MLVADDVTVTYPDSTPLDNVSVTIPQGTCAVVGPSGAGKSTLLRVLGGLQEPTAGRVLIDDEPVRRATWRSGGDTRVSIVHQDYRLVPFLSVEDNLRLAAEMREQSCSDAILEEALATVNLDRDIMGRLPSTLSGGQQQRVAIARSLVTRSPVILADEPTGALDSKNTNDVADVLSSLGAVDGRIVIVATHDQTVARRMSRGLSLDSGQVQWAW